MPAPARRSGIAVAAQHRKGAGSHKVDAKDVVTEADWDAADYSRFGTKEKNMKMTLKEFRVEHGITDGAEMADALKDWASDSVVPALCQDGCEVEPDGTCEHGCESILLRMGVI